MRAVDRLENYFKGNKHAKNKEKWYLADKFLNFKKMRKILTNTSIEGNTEFMHMLKLNSASIIEVSDDLRLIRKKQMRNIQRTL